MDADILLRELEPVVARQLDRHLASAPEWFPHELTPWHRAGDFDPTEPWDRDAAQVEAGVRSSLFVNLLTEDNLPYYFRTLETMFGRDGAWGTWVRRWTAEEGRHSIVLRDYLTLARLVNPIALERARMAQVECGEVPELPSPRDALVYTALQELATRIAHMNTGKALDDRTGYEVMKKVASDENRHYLFYRDLASAALELDPSEMMIAIERQVREFEMPGTGIVGFTEHAKSIARAGIYDFQVHHDQILVPVVLGHWRVESVEGLTAEAEQARAAVVTRIARIGKAGHRFAERREAAVAAPGAAAF